jgi:predicted nucleic acid-binding protein
MTAFVLDASVAAKWFVEEEYSAEAMVLLESDVELHAPDFFLLEMDNLVGKWLRRDVISVKEAREVRETIRAIPLILHNSHNLLDPAFEITVETGASLYDCLYIALAGALNESVITADFRLLENLAGGPFSLWVEDIRQAGLG